MASFTEEAGSLSEKKLINRLFIYEGYILIYKIYITYCSLYTIEKGRAEIAGLTDKNGFLLLSYWFGDDRRAQRWMVAVGDLMIAD